LEKGSPHEQTSLHLVLLASILTLPPAARAGTIDDFTLVSEPRTILLIATGGLGLITAARTCMSV
jgi:hypothetical protein